MEIVFYNQAFTQMLNVISNYVAKNQRRPILCTAHITVFDGKTFIEATDSAVLIRLDITSNIISSSNIEAFNFEPIGLLKMIKVIDKQVRFYKDSAKLYKVDNKYYCEYKGYSIPLISIDGTYPNIDSMFTASLPRQSFMDISIKTQNLRNILNSADNAKADVITFSSIWDKPYKPILLTIEGGTPLNAIVLTTQASRVSKTSDWEEARKQFIKQNQEKADYAN